MDEVIKNITIGEVLAILAIVAAFITTVGVITKKLGALATEWLKRELKNELQPVNAKLDLVGKNLTDVDIESCKNFLVRFLADVEQGNKIDEVEKERFHEVYKRYANLGGNSYIHDKVEKLKKEGKM